MKVVPPKTITDAILISSSAPENDHTEWSAATAYATGDYCMVAATHTIYKCLVAHTNAPPASNVSGTTPKWYEVGKTNRWRMFDDTVSSVTTASESLEVVLDVSMCDTVALFNVIGYEVTFEVTDDNDVVMSSSTASLLVDSYVDWADIFFTEPEFSGNVLRVIPVSFGTKLKITITNPGGTVSCGHCVIGRGKYLGKSRYGIQLGLTDYSKKTTNDYGETYLSQGDFANTAECDVWVSPKDRTKVKSLLSSLRATSVVWHLDNADETSDSDMIVFGFYEDFSLVVQGPTVVGCNISIQGLV